MSDSPPQIAVREVAPSDADFLVDMLLESVNWSGDRMNRKQALAKPEIAHYVTGWGRPGDFGLVAVDLGGPAGLQIPVGAAWLRQFTSADPGYGYVADDVPEVTIAIVPGFRGRGIGRALLTALLARARELGIGRVSLSVEDGNRARALYEQLGFTSVGRSGDSDTLALDL
ncbi:GCN5-related protein N-acetyltransferase [Beutenbergia cavernae DSM 12333]|uniref:GCN5-related protein N-acetyltransferase n=1 Tax=Beutenbergia cavernae (strain ATCC BAA-8 / DSM 12333 / CCUG 43141 / JCM 11478 / NBRC 16432 / NCIMB 13614 / HKI 0122) TaxID=471853 RepID=C5C0C3_BEUC1|nr:GNAT family N-acetyltransferase [Beutenbergia cavernae]ACQ79309.1 GCN5-related protein N-acetyltransferase [Beutenbergia cavernae DSM 12333]